MKIKNSVKMNKSELSCMIIEPALFLLGYLVTPKHIQMFKILPFFKQCINKQVCGCGSQSLTLIQIEFSMSQRHWIVLHI